MRLARYLAHCGVASRRAAERLITAGRVTVSGEVVTDPARDVGADSAVTVDGAPVAVEEREVWAVNKPAGVVSTARDTHGRPTVTRLVESERRLYPVGRLDADTTGLILLTNDGDLAARLTHPRHEVEKRYRARVEPPDVTEAQLRRLRSGVELEDGRTAPARARRVDRDTLEIVLTEGRKRQVRRMCEAVGLSVLALERVAFGTLALDRAAHGGRPLEPGEARRLSPVEVEQLRGAARAGRAEPSA